MNQNQRETAMQYKRYMDGHAKKLAGLTVSIMSIVEECGGDSYEQGGYGYRVYIEKQPVIDNPFEDYNDTDYLDLE